MRKQKPAYELDKQTSEKDHLGHSIHTRTRRHKPAYEVDKQASKRKRQEQENEQERRVTYTRLEVQLHVGNVGSKAPGVDMKSTKRSEHNYSLKEK